MVYKNQNKVKVAMLSNGSIIFEPWYHPDFYVSYNPSPFGSDNDECETALVKGGVYLILNGDFRDEYKKLIPKGYKPCKKFYLSKKKEFGSSWSTEK